MECESFYYKIKEYLFLIFVLLFLAFVLDNTSFDYKLFYAVLFSNKIFLLLLFFLLWLLLYFKNKSLSLILFLGELTNIFTTYILKNIFKLPRPTVNINDPYSFPSGHSSFMFFLVPFAFKINKTIGYFYLLLTIIIAYSRIVLKQHYFIDIIAGGLYSYSLSWIILYYYSCKRKD